MKRIGNQWVAHNNKYKTEYCRLLAAHYADKLLQPFKKNEYPVLPSLVRFAVEIGEYPTTVMRWTEQFPEFRKVHEDCKYIQERLIAEAALTRRYDTTFSIFYLKNKHGWVDKQDIRLQADNLQLNLNVGRSGVQVPDNTATSDKIDYVNKSGKGKDVKQLEHKEAAQEPTPVHGCQSTEQVPADVHPPPVVRRSQKGTPEDPVGPETTKGPPKGFKGTPAQAKSDSGVVKAPKRKKYKLSYKARVKARRYQRAYRAREKAKKDIS